MEHIFKLLDIIHDDCGVYIGGKKLQDLAMFLNGYICALYDFTGEWVRFDSVFQLYIELELGKKYYGGKHWDGILVEQYGHELAFDQFYIYLEAFKKIYSEVKEQDLYRILSTKYDEMKKKHFCV